MSAASRSIDRRRERRHSSRGGFFRGVSGDCARVELRIRRVERRGPACVRVDSRLLRSNASWYGVTVHGRRVLWYRVKNDRFRFKSASLSRRRRRRRDVARSRVRFPGPEKRTGIDAHDAIHPRSLGRPYFVARRFLGSHGSARASLRARRASFRRARVGRVAARVVARARARARAAPAQAPRRPPDRAPRAPHARPRGRSGRLPERVRGFPRGRAEGTLGDAASGPLRPHGRGRRGDAVVRTRRRPPRVGRRDTCISRRDNSRTQLENRADVAPALVRERRVLRSRTFSFAERRAFAL